MECKLDSCFLDYLCYTVFINGYSECRFAGGEKNESDDEDAALMLRIAELEKAEEAAEAEGEDEDDQIDEDVETDLRSAFRRSFLEDLDEESEESDADSEEAESDARTVANTLLNKDTGRHVRFEADDRMGDFQSTLVGRNGVGQASSREQRGSNIDHSVPRRDQSASSVPDVERIASTSTETHLPRQSQKPSAAQQRVFLSFSLFLFSLKHTHTPALIL